MVTVRDACPCDVACHAADRFGRRRTDQLPSAATVTVLTCVHVVVPAHFRASVRVWPGIATPEIVTA